MCILSVFYLHSYSFQLIPYHICLHYFVATPHTGANWIGQYNLMTRSYDSINMTNIRNSLHVVQLLVDIHKNDPVVVGLTPGLSLYTER